MWAYLNHVCVCVWKSVLVMYESATVHWCMLLVQSQTEKTAYKNMRAAHWRLNNSHELRPGVHSYSNYFLNSTVHVYIHITLTGIHYWLMCVLFFCFFFLLTASESDLQNKRLKLDYEEITPCLKEVTLVWEKMLGTPGRSKVKFDTETIHAAVAQGTNLAPQIHISVFPICMLRGQEGYLLSIQCQIYHVRSLQLDYDASWWHRINILTTSAW